MNIQELTTWNRLSSLDFDSADVAFPFSARLARENTWPRAFAMKAIEEYRKFCFLAVHAGHAVTPSDEVDQVWHLHLTYSRHYWDTLCRDTLERPLHHGPTEGGAAEDRKFLNWYENTLKSYRRYFGEPPKELWPKADERFDERHEFVRVDRRDVVTLDRTLLKRGALAAAAGGGMLAVANAIAQVDGGGGSDSGGALVVVLAVIGVVTAIVATAVRRGRGGKRRHAKRRRSDDAAAAAGAAPIYMPADGSHCPPGADCNTSGDGGAGAGDGGAGAGCGSSSGCGGAGGGGGCGGGGS
jgi:hypothetical protein